MTVTTRCLMLVAALTLGAGAHAHGKARSDAVAAVVLRAAADLPGTRYTLGDIADIETTDDALRRRLAAVRIGAVPRRGYTETVTRQQVEGRVRREVSLAGLELRGALTTRIRGQGQHLKAARLSDAAAAALFGSFSSEFDVITMRPVSALAGVSVPAGVVGLTVRVPSRQPISRRMSALIDVRVDGSLYTTVPVWFAVSAARPALVARVAMRPGAALRPDDFQVLMVDVAERPALALPRDTPLEGLRLRRPLAPGVVLDAGHVEPRPAVTRDERVAVRVVMGTVTIETTGRALTDARVGEMTRVRSTSTDESFPARVVGEGVVLVGAR